jgi:Fic family protein
MASFIYELPDWPVLRWDSVRLTAPLAEARHLQGRLIGQMEALGLQVKEEAVLQTLTQDVLKSSEIEGDVLDADQVRSSVARQLGMDVGGLKPADRHVDGVVEMMLDATQHYDHSLTEERLSGWHAALFPTGRSGMHRITVGAWRDDSTSPMQVVSGPVGRERVHFKAPAAARLPQEMRRFLDWFSGNTTTEPVLKAAQAHLWFVTIHPFDDGNGRIARAIADMALAASERSPRRFYSMSAQIREERADYYRILEQTQRGTTDITPWMEWFLRCLTCAIKGAQTHLAGVIAKARYWEKLRDVPLNERQRLMINKLLDNFEGKLTTSKWAALTKSSQDTALRDIQQLVERGVLVRDAAGGRSTNYALRIPEATPP